MRDFDWLKDHKREGKEIEQKMGKLLLVTHITRCVLAGEC